MVYENRLARIRGVPRLSSEKPHRGTHARKSAIQARPAGRLLRLLDELEALFLREGFQHLTIDEIARRIRCSKTTLYRLAPTSEGIYEAVVDRFLAKVRAAGVTRAKAAADWSEALIGLLSAGVTGAHDVSWEFVRDMRRHPAAQRRLLAHQRQRVTDLERLIEAGVRHEAFHDLHPRMVAELLNTLMLRVFEPDLLASVGLSLEQAYDEAYHIVEYGLVPRGSIRQSRPERKLAGRRRRRSGTAAAEPSEKPWADLW